MEKRLSAWETRRQFGKVLREVARDGDAVIVESHGEPVVAVVPFERYQQWHQRREAFFEHMRTVSERANLTDEETQDVLEEAIAAVRAETRTER
jgi:prevent-host-death family protein